MANFYCKYCGTQNTSVASLISSACSRHPDGTNRGKHALYEGIEKAQYTCKYCGTKSHSIASLTSSDCSRHPNGTNKGKHAVAM